MIGGGWSTTPSLGRRIRTETATSSYVISVDTSPAATTTTRDTRSPSAGTITTTTTTTTTTRNTRSPVLHAPPLATTTSFLLVSALGGPAETRHRGHGGVFRSLAVVHRMAIAPRPLRKGVLLLVDSSRSQWPRRVRTTE